MGSVPESKEVARARSLEKNGQHDEAAMAWIDAGLPDEAARVLITAKRFKDAGNLLMRVLRMPPVTVRELDADGRQRALRAALCLWKAGTELRTAYQIFFDLGDYNRAAKILEEIGDRVGLQRLREQIAAITHVKSGGDSGDPSKSGSGIELGDGPIGGAAAGASLSDAQALEQQGKLAEAYAIYFRHQDFFHAARMAAAMGRHAEAAQLLEGIQLYYEAAVCYRTAGNERGVLECLKKLPPSHAQYRRACQIAIQVASRFGPPDSSLLQFLKAYRTSAPVDERDVEALYALGVYCQETAVPDVALAVFRALTVARPGYRDVASRLEAVEVEHRQAGFRNAEPGSSVVGDHLVQTGSWMGEPPRTGTSGGGPVPARDSGVISQRDPGVGSSPRPKQASLASIDVASLQPGDVVADRYHVEKLLGRGGMAAVYRVKDVELDDVIAMKVVSQKIDDPQLLSRFKQEVMLSRQLSHPNIVRLYDFGSHGGLRFITMELLTGVELSTLVGKPLDVRKAIHYLSGACSGLAAVHKRGVVHRDLKPANFFITSDDVLKIMDFGIAKKLTSGEGMTVAGFFAGTPEYMSPEQIQSFSKVNHLSDLYAIGVIAYELLTGTCPFTHEEMGPLLMMHLTQTPRAPRELRPDLPEELESIILQLLEKDQRKRIQSCEEINARLNGVLATIPEESPTEAEDPVQDLESLTLPIVTGHRSG